jgi:hypothetical protein
MRWNVTEIVEAVARGLKEKAGADDAEQAVYSIDTLDELKLHPLIQQALRGAGYGVWPEQSYPSIRTKRKSKAEGRRCDVVLTHEPVESLIDPEAAATLFSPEQALPLEAAYWLEVKTVSQFTKEGPFDRYSAELLSPVSRDIKKLASDPLIFHAGLLIVLFTADERTGRHDLTVWERKCLEKGYPVAPPVVRGFALNDRMGNGYLTLALFAVRRL